MTTQRRWLIITLLICCLAWTGEGQSDSRIHIVQRGETLTRIAQNYGVTVAAIMAANNLANDRIYVGQRLIIPATDGAAPATDASIIHVVQPGETLFTIGLKYNVRWPLIQAANNLNDARIYVGQRLTIPVKNTASGAAPRAATPMPPGGVHIVQPGETLFTIGRKYNLRWPLIQAANNLPDTRVYIGQKLVIPAGSAANTDPPPLPSATEVSNNSNKRFVVDLSEQRLYAYEGETLVRTIPVSTGTARYPTITGTFYIYLRYVSANMRGPGYYLPNVPYVMYFYKGYGLHGTYWHNNFGTPMSHGCVNLPTAEAEWAYYWSSYGTPVIIQW